jgi:hypothetical protein
VKIKLALAALVLAGGAAQAADPVASGLPAGYTFSEYSGAAAVGAGLIDTDSVLWFIDEQAVAGIKSWYIFFDPLDAQRITGTVTFDTPIVNVLTTKTQLDSTNATYGIDVDHDGIFNDYTTSFLIGLEIADHITWAPGGHTITINWGTSDPGDHIRVLTEARTPPVPEPETYALFAAGLGALAWRARRAADSTRA